MATRLAVQWHGATPTTSMTRIAVQEALDGKVAVRVEHVPGEVCLAGPRNQGATA